jgi:hypothetical protein
VHQRVIRTVKFTLDGVAPAEQFLVDLQEATQGESVLPRRNPTTLSRPLAEFQMRKAARRSHG